MSELEAYATPVSKQMMRIKAITDRISLNCLGRTLFLNVEKDLPGTDYGRIFVQVTFFLPPGERWAGRKWFITDDMGSFDIMKTCYAAFESAMRHEIMKGFLVDGVAPFHPETSMEELINLKR